VINIFKNLKIYKENYNDNKKESDNFIIIKNLLLNEKTIFLLILGVLIIYLILGIELAITILIITSNMIFLAMYYPTIKEKRKYSDITTELPYVLRHMSTDLKSGKGLHDTLITISENDYGSFSNEIKRVLEEIKYGESTENALLNMAKRINSKGLSRAISQILGTLKVGGNLSNSLNIIAEDITFDIQIQLKEYSQKLNGFILIYTFLAILGPVIILIMLIAASTVMGDIIPSDVLLILYVFLFPMIVIFMGVFIKRLEPNI